jgi:hypothetical protein
MINANPAPKKARATKAGRASKASRLSVQSVATTMSDMHSAAGDMTLDPDVSVMTTTSVATQGSKKGRPRKAATAKTRKTRAKKDEAVEILEDAEDAEMPPPPPAKPSRGRKRGSEAVEDSVVMNTEAPAPKKRAVRGGRATEAVEDSIVMNAEDQEVDMVEASAPPAKQPAGRKKGRASNAKPTARKASAASLKGKASTASLRAQAAMDDELDQQLQADLERPLTEDEYMTADSESERNKPAPAIKKHASKKAATSHKPAARSQQEQQDDYAMFDPAPVEDDDAQVDEELRALEAEMNIEKDPEPLQVPKKGKKAGTRKVSRQTKKAKEPEAPPPPPEPVDEPEEDSIVVTKLPEVAPEPETVEDPDTSSGTVVNKTSSAPVTQAKRGRGRPKKTSTASQVSTTEAEPEPVVPATQAPPDDAAMEAEDNVRDSISVIKPLEKEPSRTLTSGAQAKVSRGINKSLPPAPPSPPPQSEKPAPPTPAPATPRAHHTTAPSASAKQATISPSQSPQSSDAENQPPSSKPASSSSVAAKRVVLAAFPLPPTTPGRNMMNASSSPSRRNVVAGLRSTQPWKPVDLDLVFGLVGKGEGEAEAEAEVEVGKLLKRGGTELSTPERNMTVEEWIFYNAGLAEQMLTAECEAMVNKFEVEGGRAMGVLEGLVVE